MATTNCASSYLPHEIVNQIFLRLPAKSLLRFRCVSKIWRDKIDGLDFANEHIAFGAEAPQILAAPLYFEMGSQTLHSYKFDGNFIMESDYPVVEFSNNEGYILRHIAYGLLLFQNIDCRVETLLCNPLTGEVLELPQATPGVDDLKCCSYGMGFDSTTNTFKIVRAFALIQDDYMSSGNLATEIYDMGTSSSWRRISSVPPSCLAKYGVSAHGDMHWSTTFIDASSFRTAGADLRMIISFDFRKEKFIQTPPPNQLGGPINDWVKLTNLRDSLAIIDFSPDYQYIEIWVMKYYNKKEWVREYRIREFQYLRNCLHFSAVAWGPSFLLFYSDMIDNYLFTIDLKMNILCPWRDENFRSRTNIFSYIERKGFFSYTESILSLKNFGKLVSAAEGRKFGFLKTARFIYVCP